LNEKLSEVGTFLFFLLRVEKKMSYANLSNNSFSVVTFILVGRNSANVHGLLAQRTVAPGGRASRVWNLAAYRGVDTSKPLPPPPTEYDPHTYVSPTALWLCVVEGAAPPEIPEAGFPTDEMACFTIHASSLVDRTTRVVLPDHEFAAEDTPATPEAPARVWLKCSCEPERELIMQAVKFIVKNGRPPLSADDLGIPCTADQFDQVKDRLGLFDCDDCGDADE